MATVTDYLDPKDLSRLANHQVLAKRVVEGFCSGLHRSPHKGFSVEFKQHRAYTRGDEIRRLDWKVFAKSDRFYVREYEEETNLRCNLLLDASGSMAYGEEREGGMSKLAYGSRLAACLAYLSLKQTDSVGLTTFDSKVRKVLPPRGGASHTRQIIDLLGQTEAGSETDLGKVFHEIAPQIKKRGLVIIISDCFGDIPSTLKGLAHFKHAKHDVVIFQIWHPDELDFPFRSWSRFDCLENAGNQHTIDPAHLREAYLDNLKDYRKQLVKGCYKQRVQLFPMTTNQPYSEGLASFLAARRRAGAPIHL
jgi:uncharacterized protein (DUF58 family)